MRVRRPLAAALASLLLAAGACSSGDDEPQARPGISQQRAEVSDIELSVTGADLVSPHQNLAPLDEPVRLAVLENLQQVFDATVLRPLTEGEAGSIQPLFTGDAAERAAGPDRAVLFDDGLPRVERLVADRADVRLTGLDGATRRPAMVIARIDWDVRDPDGEVRVQRVGELTLVPVVASWLVRAYSVVSTRTTGAGTTTTTAAAG